MAKGCSHDQGRFVSLSIEDTARDNPEHFVREKRWNKVSRAANQTIFVLHISLSYKIQGKNEQELFFVGLFISKLFEF